MFKDIILGFAKSPSLAKNIYEFERTLEKRIRWYIFNICLIVFILFTIFLYNILNTSILLRDNTIIKQPNIVSNPYLSYSISSNHIGEVLPNQIVTYKLTVGNNTNFPQVYNAKIDISNINKYAEILKDNSFSMQNNQISWKEKSLNSKEKAEYYLAIKTKDVIPFTNNSKNLCKIQLSFGNTIANNIKCPNYYKIYNTILINRPNINIILIIFITILLLIILLIKSVLQKRQIKVLRKNYEVIKWEKMRS